jgi:outer membrane protein TolC
VNIGAFIGLNSIGLNHLLEGGSLQAGVTPAVHLPIFNARTVRAQLKGKEGDLDVSIAQYNGAVLDALKEASDALSSSQSISRQQVDQAHALSLAQSVYQINLDRFKAGLTNQITVLQAQSQWFAQRRLAVELTAREMDNHVLLMKALGGGWAETP